jgi:hypothetical protein
LGPQTPDPPPPAENDGRHVTRRAGAGLPRGPSFSRFLTITNAPDGADRTVKATQYFLAVVQADGRIRRWAQIPEMDGRYLRVVLLADGETIHNAFFDRGFSE